MKLLLVKLLRSLKYVFAFVITYFGGNYLTIAFLNTFFNDNSVVRLIFVVGVPITVVFVLATKNRLENAYMTDIHMKTLSYAKFNLWNDIKKTVKSLDYVFELLIFLLYVSLIIAIGWRIIFSMNAFDGILIILGTILLFLILNLISWELTHLKTHTNKKDLINNETLKN